MAKKKANRDDKWRTTGGAVVPVNLKDVDFINKPKKPVRKAK